MRKVLVWLFAIVALAEAPRADAMCARQPVQLSPPSGTVLPAKATVYLFVPREQGAVMPQSLRDTLEVDGASFAARELAITGTLHVVRIDLVAAKSALTIRWRWGGGEEDHAVGMYPIGAPSPAMARVTDVIHENPPIICPYHDSIGIQLTGNAIAYRLDWEDATSTLLPPSYRYRSEVEEQQEPIARPHTIWAGTMACLGDSVDPDLLAKLRSFRLVALFSDGSERRVGSSSMRHAPDRWSESEAHDVRLPRGLLYAEPVFDRAAQCQAAPDHGNPPIAIIARCDRGWVGRFALVGLAVGALLVLVARRRRSYLPRY